MVAREASAFNVESICSGLIEALADLRDVRSVNSLCGDMDRGRAGWPYSCLGQDQIQHFVVSRLQESTASGINLFPASQGKAYLRYGVDFRATEIKASGGRGLPSVLDT
jgi:hypothetical protein